MAEKRMEGRMDSMEEKMTNVLKNGPVTEPEMLPVHGSLVEPVVKPRSDR